MQSNMGRADRAVRLVFAAVIAVLLIAGLVKGTAAAVLAVVAALLLITTLLGFCPTYVPFRVSTKGQGKADKSCAV